MRNVIKEIRDKVKEVLEESEENLQAVVNQRSWNKLHSEVEELENIMDHFRFIDY